MQVLQMHKLVDQEPYFLLGISKGTWHCKFSHNWRMFFAHKQTYHFLCMEFGSLWIEQTYLHMALDHFNYHMHLKNNKGVTFFRNWSLGTTTYQLLMIWSTIIVCSRQFQYLDFKYIFSLKSISLEEGKIHIATITILLLFWQKIGIF